MRAREVLRELLSRESGLGEVPGELPFFREAGQGRFLGEPLSRDAGERRVLGKLPLPRGCAHRSAGPETDRCLNVVAVSPAGSRPAGTGCYPRAIRSLYVLLLSTRVDARRPPALYDSSCQNCHKEVPAQAVLLVRAQDHDARRCA